MGNCASLTIQRVSNNADQDYLAIGLIVFGVDMDQLEPKLAFMGRRSVMVHILDS